MQQVLFNLIRNGIEAMQDQPRRELMVATTAAQGGMVEISVADTGPGLPDDVRSRLFQPFVTTKPTGMGVGLSVCQGIVQLHGGRLWADDRIGGGHRLPVHGQTGRRRIACRARSRRSLGWRRTLDLDQCRREQAVTGCAMISGPDHWFWPQGD